MAKAKYSRQKNGYFQARVWDGTYQGTQKHYVTIRSKKSSKDLEVKVQQYNDRINGLREVVNQNILLAILLRNGLLFTKQTSPSERSSDMLKSYPLTLK